MSEPPWESDAWKRWERDPDHRERTRQEVRAERQRTERNRLLDNRRSIRILALLSAKPRKRKGNRK